MSSATSHVENLMNIWLIWPEDSMIIMWRVLCCFSVAPFRLLLDHCWPLLLHLKVRAIHQAIQSPHHFFHQSRLPSAQIQVSPNFHFTLINRLGPCKLLKLFLDDEVIERQPCNFWFIFKWTVPYVQCVYVSWSSWCWITDIIIKTSDCNSSY